MIVALLVIRLDTLLLLLQLFSTGWLPVLCTSRHVHFVLLMVLHFIKL